MVKPNSLSVQTHTYTFSPFFSPFLLSFPPLPLRVCLTSANMSKAAWGALQKRGSQLLIRHYEMGVLFLPSAMQQATFTLSRPRQKVEEDDVTYLPSSSSSPPPASFPVPYSLPLCAFSYEGEDQPWVHDRSYPTTDHLGKRYRHSAKAVAF